LLDKTRLALYNKRNAAFNVGTDQERSDGRMGLVPCGNPECFNSEDGHTAFSLCGYCKGPMYCSGDCQATHWTVHQKECKEEKRENEEQEKSENNLRNAMHQIMGVPAATVVAAPGSKKRKKGNEKRKAK
jgi:hypothetical protein